MQEEGTLKKRPVTGRLKKIQSSSMTRLHQLAIKNPLASNKQLAKRMEETVETTISRWTIGRDLEKLGLVRKRPRRAPVLTQRHKDARLAWCLQHKDWDWNGVVFSDEARFQSQANIRKMLVKVGNTPRHEMSKFAPSIMVWGGISSLGTTPLEIVVGTIDSDRYCHTLDNILMPSMKELYGCDIVLQQDNATCHTSMVTKEHIRTLGVKLLPWPAQSPDLNPIENVWGWMKNILGGYKFKDFNEFKEKVEEIWNGISHSYLKSLIDSMDARIDECIEANGGHTSY